MANRNPNINNLKSWRKGQSGNPKGRPRNKKKREILAAGKKALRAREVALVELRELYAAIMAMTFGELRALAQLEDAPVFVRSYAFAVLHDTSKGKTDTIDKMALFVFGGKKARRELIGEGFNNVAARVLTKQEISEVFKAVETII